MTQLIYHITLPHCETLFQRKSNYSLAKQILPNFNKLLHFVTLNSQRRFFFICLLLVSSTILIAQTNDDYVKTNKAAPTLKEDPWNKIKEKLYTGGNIGMQFGTITFVNLSPMLGYRANQYLTTGIGLTYNYIRFNNITPSVENHIYGGRTFIRFFPLRNVFLHTEYEALNSNWDVVGKRFFIYNLLAGVGYNYQIGERAFANITALWNLLPGKYAIYTNPIIRVGFTIGI